MGFQRNDPGAELDAGKKQRQVVAAQRGKIAPRRVGAPGGGPAWKVGGRHRARDAVALSTFATELQQHGAVLDGLDALGDRLAVKRAR